MLFNLIKDQRPDINEKHLKVRFPFESKYQFLNNRREKVAFKTLKTQKAFTDYPQTIVDVYKNLEDYNL